MHPVVSMLEHRKYVAQDALTCALMEIDRCQRTEQRLSSGGYPISPEKLETFRNTCLGHMQKVFKMQGVMHKLRWRISVFYGKKQITCTEVRYFDVELLALEQQLNEETKSLNAALMKARYADDDFVNLPIVWRIVKMNMGDDEWKRNFQSDRMWMSIIST